MALVPSEVWYQRNIDINEDTKRWLPVAWTIILNRPFRTNSMQPINTILGLSKVLSTGYLEGSGDKWHQSTKLLCIHQTLCLDESAANSRPVILKHSNHMEVWEPSTSVWGGVQLVTPHGSPYSLPWALRGYGLCDLLLHTRVIVTLLIFWAFYKVHLFHHSFLVVIYGIGKVLLQQLQLLVVLFIFWLLRRTQQQTNWANKAPLPLPLLLQTTQCKQGDRTSQHRLASTNIRGKT